MRMNTRIVSPVVLVVLLGTVGAGLLSGCGDSSASSARNVDVEEPRLATVMETGERSFSGVAVNNNAQDLEVIQIEVALYDASGARVGTATIEVEDIPANGRKKFMGGLDTDAPVAGARVRSIAVP